MISFQACIGASANKCHIREEGEYLVLCQSTASARNVEGTVHNSILCKSCIFVMAEKYAGEKARGGVIPKIYSADDLAQVIGLEKII